MNKYFKILEFDKVIEQVKEYAVLDSSKNTISKMELFENIEDVREELELTDTALVLINRLGSLPIHLTADVRPLISLVDKKGVLSISELVIIMSYLDTLRDIKVYQDKMSDYEIDASSLLPLFNSIFYSKELNLRIKDIINYDGEVLDTASLELRDIRKRIRDTESSLKSKLQELISRYGDKLSSASITIRNDRYVIPVKNDYKNLIKGITHDSSASGETVYIEPVQVFELTNKLSQHQEDEKREIFRILQEVSGSIASHGIELSSSYNVLEKLDIVYSRAKYSININGSKPSVNDEGILELMNAHHPLLNVENVVSNNIIIGRDYKGIIITGPNTGGKTVLLKTIGLLSLMTKFGLLIPASSESNVMIFDCVYADIGDEQSIEANLSTFSSHITNVIDIMNKVDENSLVLLDELGSGTDPIEGSSLAISIFDYLISKHCLIVATSHYSELKIHAYSSEDMINASVEFDEQTLKPTYRLLIGVPGMSNALNIARRLGLNSEVVKKAKDNAYNQSDDINDILNKLIKQSKVLDKKISEADNIKKDLQQKLIESEEKYKKALEEQDKIIKKANDDASQMIEKKMLEVEELLYDIKTLKNKSASLPELADLKHRAKSIEDDYLVGSSLDKHEFEVNDNVYIKSYECYGTINKIINDKKIVILMGNATITVPKDDLRYVEKQVNDYVHVNKNIEVKTAKSVKSTLDLRGKRYEEASDEIDKFLDDCIYANLSFCNIIHGFGTGIMRELVHEKLNKNKAVKEYRYGGPGEGGQGVTVVTFKD